MTIRNLEHVLAPRSVAIIGASTERGSVGNVLTENLLGGGFTGEVYLVNPHHVSIGGRRCYRDVASLPEAPELAVIATKPDTVPALIGDWQERHARRRHGHAGFWPELKQTMLDQAKPYCLRIIGPNCLGIAVPMIGLHANFGLIRASRQARLSLAIRRADHRPPRLGRSPRHRVLLCRVDGRHGGCRCWRSARFPRRRRRDPVHFALSQTIPAARKSMSAARSAARAKPVIPIKPVRHRDSARAWAATHTGALAGSDAAVSAAFRRAGLVRVEELEELFAAAETLTSLKRVAGNELMILTNGGGAGVLAVDDLIQFGRPTLRR